MQSSYLMALAGGGLIGLSAAAMMFFNGRVAGISGIVGGLLRPVAGEVSWRLLFVFGLLAGGLVASRGVTPAFGASEAGMGTTLVAGLLVGIGTRLGNGCTSGHGVCGIARGSRRSLAATLTFIATGALTVHLVRGFA
ncbi:MAG: YeeE/YedE family protein [Myxococcales bacterium]|nr:YeeE/YedE family protein [Myxococcales bacterium]